MMPPAADAGHFVKSGPATRHAMFVAEADGLAALHATGAVRVPAVIDVGTDGQEAWIVLERLALRPLDRAAGTALGRALAQLHRTLGPHFGWERDNFIGAAPQENAPAANWPLFYAQRRLQPQLRRALANGMERALYEKGERLAERVAAFFVGGHPAPSLLHGDLWSGNASALPDGTPAIFDPAVYYGDREADLAMAELFGGFPESFYAAYREAWPLSEGFAARKELYNLYHVLNHFNLFGVGYLDQARRMIDKSMAELRG
ncbi:MAG: fructosamine kinase family protein [Rhodocyclaceae bacterium]|nr:fructosamine kinase family protein [Rhodocyclaceae bacterium]